MMPVMTHTVTSKDALVSVLDALFEEFGEDLPATLRLPINLFRRLASRATGTQLKDLRKATKEDIEEVLRHTRLATEYAARAGITVDQMAACFQDVITSVDEIAASIEGMRGQLDDVLQFFSVQTLDAEIDAAKKLVEDLEIDIALHSLNRLRDRAWDRLPARQRFRLLANLGTAHNQAGEFERAAPFFIEAEQFAPEDPKAIGLAAAGLMYQGHEATALEKVIAATHRFPDNALLLEIYIRASPESTSLDELEEKVPAGLKENTGVLHALSMRAARIGDHAAAEKYARGLAHVETSLDSLLLLGSTLLARETAGHRFTRARGAVMDTHGRIDEAIDALTAACEKYGARIPRQRALHLFHNRAVGFMLRGQDESARRDLERCMNLSPNDEQVIKLYARIRIDMGEWRAARDLLTEQFNQSRTAGVGLALCAAWIESGHAEAPAKAREILYAVEIPESGSLSGEQIGVVDQMFDLYCRGGDIELAQRTLSHLPQGIPDLLKRVMEARLCRAQGDTSKATRILTEAVDLIRDDTDWATQLQIADELTNNEAYDLALPLWKRLVPPDSLGPLHWRVVHVALKAEDFGFIREYTKSLREQGYFDVAFLEIELNTLQRFNALTEAIDEMQVILSSATDDKVKRQTQLWLSLTAVRLGKSDLINAKVEDLPAIDDVNFGMGSAVVQLLISQGSASDGINYAYKLFRRFANREDSYQILIATVILSGRAEFASTDVIQRGTAFAYVDENGASHWRVIEDDAYPPPDLSRNELAPADEFAKLVIGRKIGDEVSLGGTLGRNRSIRIVEIVDKHLYRARTCFQQFQVLFPLSQFLRSFRVIDEKGDFDPSAIIEEMKRHHEAIESIETAYRKDHLPLHFMVVRAGRPMLDTMEYLIGRRIGVRCCYGRIEDQKRAAGALATRPPLVLDETAIATLLILDSVDVLALASNRLIVSEGTVARLVSLRDDLQVESPRSAGRMHYHDGRIVVVESSSAEAEQRLSRVDAALTMIQHHANPIGGFPLAAKSSEIRAEMVTLFGQETAESCAIAETVQGAVWVDDRVVNGYGVLKGQAPCVPTYAVLQSWAESGALDPGRCTDLRLRLLSLRYDFIPVNGRMVHASVRASGGDPDVAPLTSVLDHLGNDGMTHASAIALSGIVMTTLIEQHGIDRSEPALLRLIMRIRQRAGGDVVLGEIERNFDKWFGLHPSAAMRIRQLIGVTLPSIFSQIVMPSPIDVLRYGRQYW